MKKLYLVGGGGHCRACIDVIEMLNEYEIAGVFDRKENVGGTVLKYPIIDSDESIQRYIEPNSYFLITLGQIKNPLLRQEKFDLLKKSSANLATIISPRAHVSTYATVEGGTIVMHDALVSANAKVGTNCIINTKALIEHDAVIERGCHISTGAIVNGGCTVKEMSFVGSQSVLEEGAIVEAQSLIGAGVFFRGERREKK